MKRGQYVLMVPSEISPKDVSKLTEELEGHGATVVGKDEDIVIAKWDDNARIAVRKGLSIQAFHVDRVSPGAIKKLPERVARMAILWNWSIDQHNKKVTERQVKGLMQRLQLEVREEQVYDKLSQKYLGKVKHREKEEKKGNWQLAGSWGYSRFPGPLGDWTKHSLKSVTYTSYPNRSVVYYILAEVDGPHHYACQYKYHATVAYAEDWAWEWFWDRESPSGYSYAKGYDGSTQELNYS